MKRIATRSPYSFLFKIRMASWWAVEAFLFRPSLHKMNSWRCLLLRCFGAKVGSNTFIHSRARIWFPWNFEIGSNSGVGFDTLIYNLDRVVIGDWSTVSQRSHINTGSHDYLSPSFDLLTRPVVVDNFVFIGADSYVSFGVWIGSNSVIGARSVVVKDIPSGVVAVGHPCVPIKNIERFYD